MAILEVHDLTSGYGEVQILWGINIAINEDKLTAIVGTNGVGKTTLLKTIMGLVRPWSGLIVFDGDDVTKLSPHAKADMGLILIPEGRLLFTDMSLDENLEMGASPKRARGHVAKNRDLVYTIFPRLKERHAQRAGTLSGGEQQMLAVGRGIMAEPRLLMIDELSLGLAPVLVLDLFEKLDLLKQAGITILLVEQNVQMALAVSDYAFVISEGKVTMDGTADELAQNEQVRMAYLGL